MPDVMATPRPATAPRAIVTAVATGLIAAILAGVTILAVPALLGPALAGFGSRGVEAGITVALFGMLIALGLVGNRVQRIAPPLFGRARAGTAGIGLSLGLVGLLLATGLASLAGLVVRGTPAGTSDAALLLGLGVVLVQVLGEEVFVRGWLLPSLSRGFGVGGAVIATALLFAALHLLGGARSPVTLVNLALGGVLFGLLAVRSGGLLAPIAAHFAWNASEMLLLGLDPNPGVSVYGAVWNLDLVGATIWGGSPEGLNASIAMTVVLVAMILPVAAWRGGVATATAPASAQPASAPAGKTPEPNRHAWLLGEEA